MKHLIHLASIFLVAMIIAIPGFAEKSFVETNIEQHHQQADVIIHEVSFAEIEEHDLGASLDGEFKDNKTLIANCEGRHQYQFYEQQKYSGIHTFSYKTESQRHRHNKQKIPIPIV